MISLDYALRHVYKSSNITFPEQIEINKILRNYDLNIIGAEKIRSVYKIITQNGDYCLKKISNGEKRAIKSISIMEYLKIHGFNNVANPFYSITGEKIVKIKSSSYYITDWIDALEVDFDDPEHIIKSAQLLAEFHNKAKGFRTDTVKIRSNIGKLPHLYDGMTASLNRLKEKLDLKTDKDSFDNIYHSNIDYYINQAQYASSIIKHSGYNELCENCKREMYICHDSFYYQNILKDDSDNYFLIDLESCLYDLPLVDLGKFLRRIMSNKKSLWSFDLCKRIVYEYGCVRKMDEKEYKVLLAVLIFPYKFYKLGKKNYFKMKKWKKERFLKKLNKILEYRECKEKFIERYIKYYDITV